MARPRTVTDEELIETVEEIPLPVVNAEAVSERVEIGRKGVRKRLNQLVEDGEMAAAEIGASTVYWRPRGSREGQRYFLRGGTVYVED